MKKALEELKRNEGLEKRSSPVSTLTSKVNDHNYSSFSSSHAFILVGDV